MEERITISKTFKIICSILILVGIVTFVFGFLTNPKQTWGNYLLNNFYFLSLSVGAMFFLALQYISQSGWSAGFKRIPEAMGQYIIVAAIFFILLYIGVHSLYHWTHLEEVAHDELLQHKVPFLNIPFFFIRLLVYFSAWIVLYRIIRKLSLKEDEVGGMVYFEKSEFWSKVFIFVIGITFSLASFDWIMSLDPHWYSALFSLKNFISAFHHGSAIILLIVLILNDRGHFKFLNKKHLHDFSRYIFMLAIVWGYFWFSQFMLIWYGNIPEETAYYFVRWEPGWKIFFFLNIILNWFIPFIVLFSTKASQSKLVLKIVIGLLIIGQWTDLYEQIMPSVIGVNNLGWIEIGTFIGYAALFILVVGIALSKANLYPINHPYLEETLEHGGHE
jgi:Ni/Fe-hydrogenase subunit HybB-like protein